MLLDITTKEQCHWDLISLGEVMLRFDPGARRIWTARTFEASEGGGEYNVARGLKRCFGLDTALVTAMADNPIGRLLQDLIYRESLWKANGGKKRAQEVNRRIAPLVDVMLGNEEDFSAALGYEVEGIDEHISKIEVESFKNMLTKVLREFPFKVVATTLRKATTATLNDWGAICYCDGNFYEAKRRENLEIFDRVGGGDSFASSLIYGFLTGQGPQWAVECGAAHGALAMTTPGDTTMVTLKEVLQTMQGVGARI